jgi:hypothetical protein
MELKEIENVGDVTLEKLKENNYNTINDLEDVTFIELIDMGLSEKAANSIINVITENDRLKEEITEEFDLEKQNKYLVAGFKVSKYYTKDLKSNKLKEAFEKFKGE